MVFSSIPFLYYFLPAVLMTYFLVPDRWKNAVLLVSSLIFYGWGEPKMLALMVFTIGLFYICGLAMEKSEKKRFWLLVSVIISIALLGLFKYADFLIDNFNRITGLSVPFLKLALPVGISFYTFQCLSYTIDVYRGRVKAQKSLIAFGAYVALFPQLIAGPIVRYADVVRELEHRSHSWENLSYGLRRFLVGLGKKILLADNFALLLKLFRESGEPSVLFYWMYAVGFTLNIYFDFSGYSDMAIGLGRIFGFHFLENFNYPYLSRSVTEFWRRWHMSLGGWFRDYVYIPLGGSRTTKGKWLRNVLVVWMLTGIWHGASWNFLLWGLYYGVLLLVEKLWLGKHLRGRILPHLYVILVTVFGFVLFRHTSAAEAVQEMGVLLGLGGLPAVNGTGLYYLKSYGVLLLLAVLGATPLPKKALGVLQERVVDALQPVFVLAVLVLVTACLVDGSFNPFLYFRF